MALLASTRGESGTPTEHPQTCDDPADLRDWTPNMPNHVLGSGDGDGDLGMGMSPSCPLQHHFSLHSFVSSFLRLGSWNVVMFVSYEQLQRAVALAWPAGD